MRNNPPITALKQVITYSAHDEIRDFSESPSDNHIFCALAEAAKWVGGACWGEFQAEMETYGITKSYRTGRWMVSDNMEQ
jgi:hypothetical protein